MTPQDQDFEAVARWMDGEPVELTAAQRTLADELAANEAALSGRLDAVLPPVVLARVQARCQSGLAKRAHLAFRWGLRLAAGAVAAAAVAVIAVNFMPRHVGPVPGASVLSAQDLESMLHVPGADLDARARLLSAEIADYEVRLALADSNPIDASVSALELDMQEVMAGQGEPTPDSLD